MSRKNLLVIGGTGFLGSHFLKRSIKKKFNTFSISNNRVHSKKKIIGVKYFHCNCLDEKKLKKLLKHKKFDYVINSSGYIDHSKFSQESGKKSLMMHFDLVRNIISCLNLQYVKKFIQIGSSDEYGKSACPQVETFRESPISPYSLGKTAISHFLQMLHLTEKFKVTIVRIFLAYGPGQDLKRFFPQIIKGCLNNSKFPTSSGNQLRDFLFIDDVVEAIFKLLNCKKAEGEIVNIGSGKAVKIKNLIKKVVKIIGKGKPEFGKIPYRKGENMCLVASTKKINKLIKWRPKYSLDKGLKKTINYYEKKFKTFS